MDTKKFKGPIGRKPYRTPTITVYGDAKLLTKAVGTTAQKGDGGPAMGINKTG